MVHVIALVIDIRSPLGYEETEACKVKQLLNDRASVESEVQPPVFSQTARNSIEDIPLCFFFSFFKSTFRDFFAYMCVSSSFVRVRWFWM